MKYKLLPAVLVAVLSLTACEDLFEDGSLQPDGSKPVLEIQNPTTSQVLSAASGLRVRLTSADKDKVKELQVRVRDVGGDADYINFTTYPNKKILDYDTLLSISGLRQGAYTLTVQAMDYRTNVTSDTVGFTVK